MRLPLSLAATALLIAHAPAEAGSKAIYAMDNNQSLQIEVADNGDARVGGATADQYGLLVGGAFYLVGKDDGTWKVARIADQAAAFDKVLPPIFKTLFSGGDTKAKPGAPAMPKARKTGTRTVAGVAGDVYAVSGLDAAQPAETVEIVATSDPRLVPVGRALNGFMEATFVMMAPLLGKIAADQIAIGKSLAPLGTPLQAGKIMLTSFAEATVDPARVSLPAAPQTVEQLVAAIKVTPIDGAADNPAESEVKP